MATSNFRPRKAYLTHVSASFSKKLPEAWIEDVDAWRTCSKAGMVMVMAHWKIGLSSAMSQLGKVQQTYMAIPHL